MDEADISAAVSAVACKIFGRDGWKKSARRPIPLRGVLDCTRAWVVTIWKSWVRKVGRDRNVLEKLEASQNEVVSLPCTHYKEIIMRRALLTVMGERLTSGPQVFQGSR